MTSPSTSSEAQHQLPNDKYACSSLTLHCKQPLCVLYELCWSTSRFNAGAAYPETMTVSHYIGGGRECNSRGNQSQTRVLTCVTGADAFVVTWNVSSEASPLSSFAMLELYSRLVNPLNRLSFLKTAKLLRVTPTSDGHNLITNTHTHTCTHMPTISHTCTHMHTHAHTCAHTRTHAQAHARE